MPFPKPKRLVDKKLLAVIKNSKCIICGISPSDPDHIKHRGSGGEDTPINLWPLCRSHHIERHQIGLTRFTQKYPQALRELIKRGKA